MPCFLNFLANMWRVRARMPNEWGMLDDYEVRELMDLELRKAWVVRAFTHIEKLREEFFVKAPIAEKSTMKRLAQIAR